MSRPEMKAAGKRVFKLINNEVILGEVYSVTTEGGGVEIMIKQPFTAKNGNIMPYMVDVLTSAPGGVQIHPMNVIWSVPLDEFPEANKVYIEATSGIITESEKKIIY